MEPLKNENEQPQPASIPPTQEAEPVEAHRAHTYQDDLSKAMDATDAKVVQELLGTAREKEAVMKETKTRATQRKWYSLFAVILFILALGALGYGYWTYRMFTVPVQKTLSVGVFPNTDAVAVETTDIRQTIAALVGNTTLPENKPMLVPLVTDTSTLTSLSIEQFFSFIEAHPDEPFSRSIDIIRLGIMHSDNTLSPFIILSVNDPETASKEFLIAEPDLLQLFYKALNIDIGKYQEKIGKGFASSHIYNLPVRILSQKDEETGTETTTLLYGYVTNNIIVLTTDPVVLKAVYDTIIRQ